MQQGASEEPHVFGTFRPESEEDALLRPIAGNEGNVRQDLLVHPLDDQRKRQQDFDRDFFFRRVVADIGARAPDVRQQVRHRSHDRGEMRTQLLRDKVPVIDKPPQRVGRRQLCE